MDTQQDFVLQKVSSQKKTNLKSLKYNTNYKSISLKYVASFTKNIRNINARYVLKITG